MDRDKIERRDFPTGRRGYDPAAVDEHLRRVADEFETQVHGPVPSLSSGTADQVRLILEAAERGASEMQARAGEEASAHVTRVQESAEGLMAKLDQLEGELGRLLSALRASGERLTEGLAELQAEVGGGSSVPEVEPIAEVDVEAELPEPVVSDEAGARLIALNMALGGSSREETGRYLVDHFGIADPEALLDDVYARVGQ